jgi:hypothetical protein
MIISGAAWSGTARALRYGIWHAMLHCNILLRMVHMQFLHTTRGPETARTG